ncbi:MAG: hypothetical protein AAGA56_08270, partial [Myxococcota bacterium]
AHAATGASSDEPAEAPTDEPAEASTDRSADKEAETHAESADAEPADEGVELKRPVARRRPQRGAPHRNVVLFVFLVGGLSASFGFLGNPGRAPKAAKPAWRIGQTVKTEITVVSTDAQALACAMKKPVKDHRCAFDTRDQAAEGIDTDATKNPKLLQPFTAVNRQQFLASNLWTQPPLQAKLATEKPGALTPRFSVKCQMKILGKTKDTSVRWEKDGPWYAGNGWFIGDLSDCRIKE